MKRSEASGRVVYVHRRRWMSVPFFVAAIGISFYGAFVECPGGPDHRHWIPTLVYGVLLSAAALGLLLQERAFVIDQVAGTLRIVHRGFFGRVVLRRLVTLRNVSVRTTSAETTHSLGNAHWIWLDLPDTGRLLFEGPLRSREIVRERVELLSADLKG
jgi:hypothetical protein